ncbi:MAG: protein-disulfide reductase DsbD family protein [Bacteroidota bacterium]|nr:protein-disulfide reductase DsbD family protein [Bacteroidota bacterium]
MQRSKHSAFKTIILSAVIIFFSSFVYDNKAEVDLLWKAEIMPACTLKKGDTAWVVLQTDIPKGYHSYSNENTSDDGPILTQLNFEKKKKYKLIGKDIIEGEKEVVYEEVFKAKFTKVKGHMVVKRKFKVTSKTIKFKVMTQICDENVCILKEKDFELKIY